MSDDGKEGRKRRPNSATAKKLRKEEMDAGPKAGYRVAHLLAKRLM